MVIELPAVREGAVLLAVGHDVPGHRTRYARDVSQEARARGVHVHAHAVDHVLDHVAEGAGQLRQVEIVLVPPHAYGLRRNLDQLRERVLEAPPQAHGAARGNVEVRVLLARELGGGVDRGPCLVDYGVAQVRRLPGNELGDDLLGLAAGGAVAYDDGVDVVLLGEAGARAWCPSRRAAAPWGRPRRGRAGCRTRPAPPPCTPCESPGPAQSRPPRARGGRRAGSPRSWQRRRWRPSGRAP